jgi:hypothetical protein
MAIMPRPRSVVVLCALLAPVAAQADRITAAYPELATTVANDAAVAASPRPRASPRRSRFDADVDYQKMAIITEDALGRGYRIMWVNPPQKRRASDKSDR